MPARPSRGGGAAPAIALIHHRTRLPKIVPPNARAVAEGDSWIPLSHTQRRAALRFDRRGVPPMKQQPSSSVESLEEGAAGGEGNDDGQQDSPILAPSTSLPTRSGGNGGDHHHQQQQQQQEEEEEEAKDCDEAERAAPQPPPLPPVTKSKMKSGKGKGKGKGKGRRRRRSRAWKRLVRWAGRRKSCLAWGCGLLVVASFIGAMIGIYCLVLRRIHPVDFAMTRCALVDLIFEGPVVKSIINMGGRITSRCNFTTWTEPYYVDIFYQDVNGSYVPIGRAFYPAMVLPPFATHELSQNGTFEHVPQRLMQESMTKQASQMGIHMVARTRAQAFGVSLPRVPSWFDMRCRYVNHWGQAPEGTVCESRLRPLWMRVPGYS